MDTWNAIFTTPLKNFGQKDQKNCSESEIDKYLKHFSQQKKLLYHIYLWAATMQQFWQPVEKLAANVSKNCSISGTCNYNDFFPTNFLKLSSGHLRCFLDKTNEVFQTPSELLLQPDPGVYGKTVSSKKLKLCLRTARL